jgi:N-acyl-D-amino-acid deacylase
MNRNIFIKGGTVFDGAGGQGISNDIYIEGDAIKAVGDEARAMARADDPALSSIDATGKIVCPGFIDMHAHSDYKITVNGSMEAKLRQGVTTAVLGSCGFSGAPVNDRLRRDFRGYLSGMFGSECQFEWDSTAGYIEHIKRIGIGANVFLQTGFGNLRQMTMGRSPLKANAGQIAAMKKLLEKSLEEGARGFSAGLAYPMQMFSSREEVKALCGTAAKRGALFSVHVRNEIDKLAEANREAIGIAEETGVSLQISHHKAILSRNWGKPRETMKMMEDARARGVDVEADVYPFTAFSNILATTMLLNEPGMEEKIIFLELKKLKQYEGRSLADVMKDTGKGAKAAALHILLNEGFSNAPVAGEFISEDDLRFIMSHPLSSIGSDGVETDEGAKAHPRLFSTTVRFLKHYALGEKLMPMGEAVRKMTSMPARKIGAVRRGLIKEGYFADIVVFDPDALRDNSTYEDPVRYPSGFESVIVNGEMAVIKDEITGARAGTVL